MDILVQPLNRVIRAEPGVNLLDALRAAQVPMSYSCLSGRCGICRCRVLSGEVLDGGREQQRPLDGVDGAVLACQTYVTEPCTIEVPAPGEAVVHRARVAKATVVAIEPLAADIRRLLLKVAKPIAFSPGQYMQLGFTPTHVRPYSMANLPGEQLLEFHIQLMPQGRVSGPRRGGCGRALARGGRCRAGPLGVCGGRARRHGGAGRGPLPLRCRCARRGCRRGRYRWRHGKGRFRGGDGSGWRRGRYRRHGRSHSSRSSRRCSHHDGTRRHRPLQDPPGAASRYGGHSNHRHSHQHRADD